MTDSTASAGLSDAPDVVPFRVGPAYVDTWCHEFSHWEHSPQVAIAVDALRGAMRTLLILRDGLQRARGEFGPVSCFYPENGPTENQRQRLHAATVGFFQGYYFALDRLATLIAQHPDVFGSIPHRSLAKFIERVQPFALFSEATLPLLEQARRFRALLEHASSLPPHTWITAETTQFNVRLMLIGALERGGGIPDGATRINETDSLLRDLPLSETNATESPTAEWCALAPDEDLTVWALAVQLNAIIGRIMAHRDNSSVVTCAWQPTPTGDDVTLAYPVYAVIGGTVTGTWQTDFTVQANTTFTSARGGQDDGQRTD